MISGAFPSSSAGARLDRGDPMTYLIGLLARMIGIVAVRVP